MAEGAGNGKGRPRFPRGSRVTPIEPGVVLVGSALGTAPSAKACATTTPIGRVKVESMALAPLKHEPGTLDSFAINFSGGMSTFFEYARWSRDPRIEKMVNLWDNSPVTIKDKLSATALARECGIDPFECAGAITIIAMKSSKLQSGMIAAQFMPKVAEANALEALKPEGVIDRKMFMEATGILPTVNKGVTLNQQLNINTPVEDLPSFSSSIMGSANAVRKGDGITPPTPPTAPQDFIDV